MGNGSQGVRPALQLAILLIQKHEAHAHNPLRIILRSRYIGRYGTEVKKWHNICTNLHENRLNGLRIMGTRSRVETQAPVSVDNRTVLYAAAGE